MTTASAESSTVRTFRLTGVQRAGFLAVSLAALAFCIGLAVTESIVMGLFVVPAVVSILHAVRSKLEVDLDRQVAISTRAFRRSVVRFADIVSVRVPPWGPVALTLRPGTPKHGGGIWPGQVITGIYTDHRGRDGLAVDLAALLNVPIVSIWPQVRSRKRRQEDFEVRFNSVRTVEGAATWLLTVMLVTMLVVVLGAIAVALLF